MLNTIIKYQNRLKKRYSTIHYKRYLFDRIDFEDKMIAIFGARGVGKTTLLFQRLFELEDDSKNALYISLDYPFLAGEDLIEIIDDFVQRDGEYLLLDEVHRFKDFSAYLKTIYDLFDIKVIFTGSSATSILSAKSDLSRRVTLYNLYGFSFREFLEFTHKKELDFYTIEDIINNHIAIAKAIQSKIPNILKEFHKYMKVGYYPFYFEKKSSFYQNLLNTINLTIDLDLPSLGLVEQKYTYKLKRLLEVICESEPFEANFTKLASLAEISRVKLYDYITYLNDAQMLLLVDKMAKGLKKMQKPAKIYLHNTNLLYAYCDDAKIGTLRETFFANQVSFVCKLNIASQGDFLVDSKYIFEIGGKKKSFTQIKDLENSFIAADGIEIGLGNKIPLWLFGFLY